VRAYATNSAGTGYGPEATFTTLVDLPVVTTTAATAITKVSAVSGGEVTYDGGGTLTARGLAWSTTANPTIDGTVVLDSGTGISVFISNLTGLVLNTTYHVRAYATNSAGTAYGADERRFRDANLVDSCSALRDFGPAGPGALLLRGGLSAAQSRPPKGMIPGAALVHPPTFRRDTR